MTDEQLSEIEQRNQKRKESKKSASAGPWEYDSFAFIHQSETIPHNRRMGILVRPMRWFDAVCKRYGNDVLDVGISANTDMQAYEDAMYIVNARSNEAESDVDALVAEIRKLKKA